MEVIGIIGTISIFYLLRVFFDKNYSKSFWGVCVDVGITVFIILLLQYIIKWFIN
ncbi:hypothetical protein ACFVAD_19430 [Sutcliffiella sp. NPDC057660]|uniref:hypothetical protein n=1 Tax=Sutcliffiella sp. NPDC057660 TaxID=3346199 RepID=UPI00369BF1AF